MAEVPGSSLLFLRLDFCLRASRGGFCGEVSAELPDDGPELMFSVTADSLLLLRLPPSFAVSVRVTCSVSAPFARLLRDFGWAGGAGSGSAFLFLEAAGGGGGAEAVG